MLTNRESNEERGLGEAHPLVQEVLFLREMIFHQGVVLRTLHQREAVVVRRIKKEHARRDGSAARETPGASTGPRT